METDTIIKNISSKIVILNITNSAIFISILIIVIIGINLFKEKPVILENQILEYYTSQKNNNNIKINELNDELDTLKLNKFSQSYIDSLIIESYQLEAIQKLLKNEDLVFGKSIDDIINDKKLYKIIEDEYLFISYIASDYFFLEEEINNWNKIYQNKYGEYFSKSFKYYSSLSSYEDYYRNNYNKNENAYEVKKMLQLYDVMRFNDSLEKDTFTTEAIKFNSFIDKIIANNRIEISALVDENNILQNNINDEIKRIENSDFYLWGILISKAIIVIFILFILQILLTTFRYLVQVKVKYDNQLLLLQCSVLKNTLDDKVLSLLVSEKINMDQTPQPLIKDILEAVKHN